MKFFLIILSSIFFAGCTSIPYEELNLDTTSDIGSPTDGKTGIYVYQWKSGVIGSISDVDFEIKGQPILSLNTGEYGYFEVIPGKYEYKVAGGIFDSFIPIIFEANKNYFFRASIVNFSDYSYLIREQVEIDETKTNIVSGRYELYSVD
ncbi:DUF2846 domain-containing protein [Vibrio splendidus]|uniref:DUF2846 domain-containing protein n=1 Tax=Vibrio splendidus TaxID=29497 RepID=UPI002236444A|nr:DUF2846 domain-containing protein [Vibrio splendidus]MCW4445847.1 DUF2846 domain-containing protein [Vibrio splendidus]